MLKKPDNNLEGISAHYNTPTKGYALPGAKRFFSGSLGFLFLVLLFPGATVRRTAGHRKSDRKPRLSLPGITFVSAHQGKIIPPSSPMFEPHVVHDTA